MVYAILQMFIEFPYDPFDRLITDIALATAVIISLSLWAVCRG